MNFKKTRALAAALSLSALGATALAVTAPVEAASPGLNGRIVYSGDGDIYSIAPDGSDERRLASLSGDDGYPSVSPDGSKVAYVSHNPTPQVRVVNMDGTGDRALTDPLTEGANGFPTWSPDGSQIAFVSHRNQGAYEIWVMDADGSDQRFLTNGYIPEWSATGFITFEYPTSTGIQVFTVDADGLNRRQLTTNTGRTPTVSPDGTRIAYERGAQIWVMNADGSGAHQISATVGGWPRFSPDGTKVVIRTSDDRLAVLDVDGDRTQFIDPAIRPVYTPTWAPIPTAPPADTTPPGITITSPAAGATYEVGAAVTADYACADAVGVSTCLGSVPDGSPIDTATPGEFVFRVTATDGAGNSSAEERTYRVVDPIPPTPAYTFGGFGEPVEDDVVNHVKAGRTIPVRWTIHHADGSPVAEAESFLRLSSQSSSAACAGQPAEAVEEAAGGSGLQYLGSGTWQYNWTTPKTYTGQCRTMRLELADGSIHTAVFQFG